MTCRKSLGLILGLAFLIGFCSFCRQGGTNRKILFVGIDALSWEMVEGLRSQGLLPNIDRLVKKACSATINTNEWGTDSSLYWTDIATGQLSKKHGINGFVYTDPQTGEMIPNTSNRRRTKAFWDIFSEKKIRVGIVGWFITWPVETVNGFMVSSYLGFRGLQPVWKGSFYSGAPRMVYPPSLEAKTKMLSERAHKRYHRDLLRIMPRSTLAKRKPTVTQAEWAFLTDMIFTEIGFQLYQDEKPQVFAVYLNGIDVVGHRFTNIKPERNAKLIAKFGDVQKNYYLYMDEMIRPFLEAADDKTTIMIVSDHGLMRGEHQKDGVFIAAGPALKKNVRLEKPINLIDICPTMLYLMGLPVAEDMDGRVYTDALTQDYLKAHRITTIASYGLRSNYSDKPIKTNFDQKIIERLKTLGYLK